MKANLLLNRKNSVEQHYILNLIECVTF